MRPLRMAPAVPFFRPSIADAEVQAVVDVLQSGWLTSGPRVKQFEADFAVFVGAKHAIALNSATAALHLAVEALGLARGQAVLVPTMTFASTAEVVRYMDAVPVLVDCHADSFNLDFDDAERKCTAARDGRLPGLPPLEVVGMIPVHVGGVMVDLAATRRFAERHQLWVVDDAAHALPAAWRRDAAAPWIRCGEGTAQVSCFSFYANKTITTGEGGMAVTDDSQLAERMRIMALHGLSRDAWERYRTGSAWDYRIVAPGFKYNLTDIAAALGIEQLKRADEMRTARESLALEYRDRLADVDAIELPPMVDHRQHAWHLFPVSLRLEQLTIGRDAFIEQLHASGIGTSVHWRPLHLHPYYQDQFKWTAESCPTATREWQRRVSLPLFPGMSADEQHAVVAAVQSACARHQR